MLGFSDYKIKTITKYALISRFVVFTIQVISNLLVPDHDAKVFNPPSNPEHEATIFDEGVNLLFGGFKRWDAVYFQHIAEYGYTYENTLAFFPLFSIVTRIFGNTILYPLQYFMSYSNVLLLSAFVLNNYLFVNTTSMLYKLGVILLNEETLAFKAALLFCFNPASIFMSAPYSETIYCILLLKSLYRLEKNSVTIASVFIGLCSLSRSNGLVAFGFVIHRVLQNYLKEIIMTSKTNYTNQNDRWVLYIIITFKFFIKSVVCGFLATMPFLIFQFYTYYTFCDTLDNNMPDYISQYGRLMQYHILGDKPSSWCYDLIPLSYSYIQRHHWEVGFIAYYELKQIPNFLLATPIVIIGISCCCVYFKLNTKTCLTLGLMNNVHESEKKSDDLKVEYGFKNQNLLVHCAHLLILVVFGLFFMHIQVLTRFICSSCPIVFWFAAYLITEADDLKPAEAINRYNAFKITPEQKQKEYGYANNILMEQIMNWSNQNIYFKLLIVYFVCYFVFGTAAFSNFLPFT